ncbi:MAG: hypothetical protein V4489_07955 [Chlamydiota bacterium]
MELKIYVDRLKDGQKDIFKGKVSTDFMPKEQDLFFEKDIELTGEAYVAGDHLMIKLTAKVLAFIPCCICNKPTEVPLILSDFYHAEPLEEIPASVFDFSELLRTDLLLQLPKFIECQGKCPERDSIKKYLKQESSKTDNINFPFSLL